MFSGTLLPRATLDGRTLPRSWLRTHEFGGSGIIAGGSVLIDPESGDTLIDPESGANLIAPYPHTAVSMLRSIDGVVWFNPSDLDRLTVTSAPEVVADSSSIVEPAAGYPQLDVNGTDFTMFGWVYVPSDLSDVNFYFNSGGTFVEPLLVGRVDGADQSDPHQFFLSLDRSGVELTALAYDGTSVTSSPTVLSRITTAPHHQNWHFIFLTVTSAGEMTLKVDGNDAGSNPTGTFPALPNARLIFPAAHPMLDFLPEVQNILFPIRYAGWGFAREILDGDDHTELLNGGVPLNYGDLSGDLQAKLTAFWSFDRLEGGQWADSVGSLHLEESTGSIPAQRGFGPFALSPVAGDEVDGATSDTGGSTLAAAASEFRPALGEDSGKYNLGFAETQVYAPGPSYGYGPVQKEMALSPAVAQDTTGSVFAVIEFSESLDNETLILCPTDADDLTFCIAAGVPNLAQGQDYFFGLISGSPLSPGKYLIEVGWDGDKSWLRVNGGGYIEGSAPAGGFLGEWSKVGNSANQHDFTLYDLVICPGAVTEEQRLGAESYLMNKHNLS